MIKNNNKIIDVSQFHAVCLFLPLSWQNCHVQLWTYLQFPMLPKCFNSSISKFILCHHHLTIAQPEKHHWLFLLANLCLPIMKSGRFYLPNISLSNFLLSCSVSTTPFQALIISLWGYGNIFWVRPCCMANPTAISNLFCCTQCLWPVFKKKARYSLSHFYLQL